MVIIFPAMMIKDSTAKITVQENNSAVLHIIVVLIFPTKEKFHFFLIICEKNFNAPCSLAEHLVYELWINYARDSILSSEIFTLFYMFDVDDSVCMCVYVYVCAKAVQCSDFLVGDFTKKNTIFKQSDV